MENTQNQKVSKGMNIHMRRGIAYTILILISFFCLFWFYILFINATRSNGKLKSGFTLVPSSHLFENWKNLVEGTIFLYFSNFFKKSIDISIFLI